MNAPHEAFIKPPYSIAIRDPQGLDAERGNHLLVIGRGNLDTVFVFGDDELRQLIIVACERAFSKMGAEACVPEDTCPPGGCSDACNGCD